MSIQQKRDTTISISENERNMISEAAIDLFGTDEVPYAVTITRLIDDATDVEVN